MMIEGSGSGSIPLTSGSGSGRPKNMWIRWIRIPIHNTAHLKPSRHLPQVVRAVCHLFALLVLLSMGRRLMFLISLELFINLNLNYCTSMIRFSWTWFATLPPFDNKIHMFHFTECSKSWNFNKASLKNVTILQIKRQISASLVRFVVKTTR